MAGAPGQRLALAAYSDLAGAGPLDNGAPQREGVGWRYVYRDHDSAIVYMLRPDLELPQPDVSPFKPTVMRVEAVAAEDDPKPGWLEWRSAVEGLFARVTRVGSAGDRSL
jgi:hypothetical protein